MGKMSLFVRPFGDEVAAKYEMQEVDQTIAQHLQPGLGIDVLCSDESVYLGKITEVDSKCEVVRIHFPHWSTSYDYIGAFADIYCTTAHKFSYFLRKNGTVRGRYSSSTAKKISNTDQHVLRNRVDKRKYKPDEIQREYRTRSDDRRIRYITPSVAVEPLHNIAVNNATAIRDLASHSSVSNDYFTNLSQNSDSHSSSSSSLDYLTHQIDTIPNVAIFSALSENARMSSSLLSSSVSDSSSRQLKRERAETMTGSTQLGLAALRTGVVTQVSDDHHRRVVLASTSHSDLLFPAQCESEGIGLTVSKDGTLDGKKSIFQRQSESPQWTPLILHSKEEDVVESDSCIIDEDVDDLDETEAPPSPAARLPAVRRGPVGESLIARVARLERRAISSERSIRRVDGEMGMLSRGLVAATTAAKGPATVAALENEVDRLREDNGRLCGRVESLTRDSAQLRDLLGETVTRLQLLERCIGLQDS